MRTIGLILFWCGWLATVIPPVSGHTATPLKLSLADCVTRALQQNRSLAFTRQRIESGSLSLQNARSQFDIKVIPQGSLDFSGGENQEDRSRATAGIELGRQLPIGTRLALTPAIGKTDIDGKKYESTVRIALDQPLLQGLGKAINLDAVDAAVYQLRTYRRQYYLAQVDTSLRTVQAVYRIIQTHRQMAIEGRSVQQIAKVAAAARIKREIGMGSPEDVFRAEEKLKQNQTEWLASKKREQGLYDNLRTLLNLDPNQELTVQAPEVEIQPLANRQQASAIALANRLELQQAKDDLKERFRQSRLARHNLLPELDLHFSYVQTAHSAALDSDWPGNGEGQWQLGFTTSTDLRRTVEKNTYQQTLLDIEDAKHQLELTRDSIVQEVKSALRSLDESRQTMALQKNRIQTASRQMALSRLKFKHGLADNFDLLEAEQVHKSARISHLAAQTNHILAMYALQQAMGNLFENKILPPAVEQN